MKMKKRIFSFLLVCMLSISMLPAEASAAGYTPPALPDVFQGDGLYITATPLEPKLTGSFAPDSSSSDGFHGGWMKFFAEEEERDGYGYLVDSYMALHYVDKDGNVLKTEVETCNNVGADLNQSAALNYYDGMCAFYDRETERFGYLDEAGNVAIEPRFTKVSAFSDGLAAVYEELSDEFYYIDKSGNKVLGPLYSFDYPPFFSDGLLPWSDYLDTDGDGRSDDYFVGYLDKSGDAAITLYQGDWKNCRLELRDTQGYAPDCYDGSHFSEGYAIIREERDGSRYPIHIVIDTEGNEVGRIALSAPLTANILSVVHDGLIIVDFYDTDANGSAGIGAVDIHGNIVVEPGKIAAGNAYYDSGLVRGSSDSGLFVDKKANTVIPGKFAEAANVSEEQLDKELMSYFPGSAMSLQLHATNFEEGTALLTVELWLNGMSIADRWYYVLEAHEGTYTGAGKVYDAATGQVTGGGSAARPGAPAQPAADQPSSWAAGQVDEAVSAGIVPESLQSAYTQSITRAEFCALATRLYETVKGTAITERVTFTDTADENVEKMAGLGVVTGVGEGRFDPDGTLTREQAATMLSRLAAAMGRPLTAQAPTFADSAAVSTWAVDAVGQMQGSGIMGGVGDNAFDPQGSYSREQSMLTMLRLYESVK